MPIFGVDDLLFLAASTTALAWAKRGDLAREKLLRPHPTRPATASPSSSSASLTTSGSARSRRSSGRSLEESGIGETTFTAPLDEELCVNPRLLLRGFDLQEEFRREAAKRVLADLSGDGRQTSCDSDLLSQRATDNGEEVSPLVSRSTLHSLAETPLVDYQVPNVPHRHYNPAKRRPHVTALVGYSEAEVAAALRNYTLAEVHALFATMEAQGAWQAVITVTRGIEKAGSTLQYLTQRNTESALRTLLAAGKSDLALAFFFTYAEDILVKDDILLALFDSCRYMDRSALQLCETLKPFQERWSDTVYACCLTVTARLDYPAALTLYDEYMKRQQERLHKAQAAESTDVSVSTSALKRVLAKPSLLLHEGGLASDAAVGSVSPAATHTESFHAPTRSLQNLYHIIVPLVLQHDPAQADRYVGDMLAIDPDAAPDVFLQCLWTAKGRELASHFLQLRQREQDAPLVIQEEPHPDPEGRDRPPSVYELAIGLYDCKPTARNLNSLLKVTMNAPLSPPQPMRPQCKDDATNTANHPAREGSQTLPFDARLATTREFGSEALEKRFQQVPLPAASAERDAAILARSLTEHQASWALAAQFMLAMIHRRHFVVVPPLAHHLARHRQWSTVARAMSLYLSNQRRSPMRTGDVSLCIEASVHGGRWSSALFWVERAHAAGLVLPQATYDTALSVSPFCRRDASVRVLQTIHQIGGACSERGVISVVGAAANQGKIAEAMEVLSTTGGIRWVP